MRRLIKYKGFVARSKFFERLASCLGIGRHESRKSKAVGLQTARAQGRDHGAGARHGTHGKARLPHKLHGLRSRIAYRRRAGIGDKRHALALRQNINELLRSRMLVVFVHAHRRRADAVAIQQLSRLARVFAGDHVADIKKPERAQGNICNIANGKPYNVER